MAGYTICNDITTRSLVYRHDLKAIGSDWFAAKNAPTFLPTGPYLVPAKFAGDPGDLRVTLRHNGITRQDESTADMLFDLPAILAYVTGVTELGAGRPGAHRLAAGNGAHWGVFLAEGDLLEGEIPGLGRSATACPQDGRRGRSATARNPTMTETLITHLRHVDLAIPYFERQLAFYTGCTWGLTTVASDRGIAFLAAEGSPERYVLRLAQGPGQGLDLVAFGAASAGEVDALAARLIEQRDHARRGA